MYSSQVTNTATCFDTLHVLSSWSLYSC